MDAEDRDREGDGDSDGDELDSACQWVTLMHCYKNAILLQWKKQRQDHSDVA